MKIPKLKIGDIVEVIWNDTHTPKLTNWMDEIEYEKFNNDGMKIKSVGVVMSIDKHFIRLVADIDIVKGLNDKTVCRAINIGRGFIESIDVLKRAQ